MKTSPNKENGFALLMTLIVVGVVLSVGVSMLDLSIKQVRLSSHAKDSEVAFHAANAGVECARYWRRVESDDMENGEAITPGCFNGTLDSNSLNPSGQTPNILNDDDDREAHFYSYSFTWGISGQERCTKIDTLTASSSTLAPSIVEIDNMNTLFPGYPPESAGKLECDPGARCTVVSVRGYNRPCSAVNNYGVVEREVLLQY